MTWNEIFILFIMVMGLFAIDMFVAKLNLKAGRIVAVLTFFVMMPLGLVAGIAALICMNNKEKQWKISIINFCKNVLFHAFLLGIILLCLIDMILLKIFPDATFPVVFFSVCFSPLFMFLVAKVLVYLKEKTRKPTEIYSSKKTESAVNPTMASNAKKDDFGSAKDWGLEYATSIDDLHMRMVGLQGCKNLEEFKKVRPDLGEQATETVAKTEETIKVRNKNTSKKNLKKLEKDRKNKQKTTTLSTISKTDNQKQKNNTAPKCPTIPSGYAPSKPVTNSVSDYLYHYDPDYQDYLQGNIRPGRYKNIDLIPDIRPKYTDQTVKIVFSPGTTEIKEREFEDREDFISVEIPFGVTKIGKSAFNGCCNLTSVVIPKSVTKIEDRAFFGCERLKRIYISDLKKWCEIEFGKWCSNPLYYEGNLYLNNHLMTELVIPNNITKIKPYAFEGCAGLKKVVIHRGVTEIGEGAFGNCVNLDSVHISDLYQWCNIKFGYLANPLTHAKKLYLKNELVTKYAIPEGTKKVNDYIFAWYQELKELKIPNGVTEIGRRAFSHCTGLTELVFPDSLEKIEFEAFCGCSNLEKITFPKSVFQIVECAFYDCRKLSREDEIKIQENTKVIDRGDYELIMLDDGNERWVHK